MSFDVVCGRLGVVCGRFEVVRRSLCVACTADLVLWIMGGNVRMEISTASDTPLQ